MDNKIKFNTKITYFDDDRLCTTFIQKGSLIQFLQEVLLLSNKDNCIENMKQAIDRLNTIGCY